MDPIGILVHEHRVIEQVLNVLEKIVERAATARKLESGPAREAIDFFRTFADRCHHGKEEAQLFPVLEAHGLSGGCGPVAVMLREHELGRLYLGGMDRAIEGASKGDADALQWFIQDAHSYIRLLREHIQKEDRCLFPAAARVLDEAAQRKLATAFESVETIELGAGTHEKYLALANGLADRLGVLRTTAEEPCAEHPSCH